MDLMRLSSTKRISDRQKRQNDQPNFDQLQHILMLNWDKFGTGLEIRDNSASRMTLYFFGTDGHLTVNVVSATCGRLC